MTLSPTSGSAVEATPSFTQTTKVPKTKYERNATTATPLNARSQPVPGLSQRGNVDVDKSNEIFDQQDSPKFVKLQNRPFNENDKYGRNPSPKFVQQNPNMAQNGNNFMLPEGQKSSPRRGVVTANVNSISPARR